MFSVNLSGNQNLTPTFIFKKEMLTRYVVVIEDTKDMMERVCTRNFEYNSSDYFLNRLLIIILFQYWINNCNFHHAGILELFTIGYS